MPKEEHFFDVYSGDFFKKNSNNEQPLITETNNQISCDRTNYQIEKNKLQNEINITVIKRGKSNTKVLTTFGVITIGSMMVLNVINSNNSAKDTPDFEDSYNIVKEMDEGSMESKYTDINDNNHDEVKKIQINDEKSQIKEQSEISEIEFKAVESSKSDIKEQSENKEVEPEIVEESKLEIIEPIIFNVGTASNIDDINEFLNNTYEGELINKYSKMYGVSPSLVVAICAQESGLRQDNYGAATGLFSLENIGAYDEWIYNYDSNEMEEITIDSDLTYILENNVKWAIALMRKKIDYFDGNIYAAIQSYNFSEYMVDYILNTNGIVLNGYTDYSFIPYMKDASDNPYKYGVEMESYGDGNYIENVLRFCPESIITYKYKDNEITVNLATAKVLDVKKTEYNNQKSR